MSISFAAPEGSPCRKINQIKYGVMNQWPHVWLKGLRIPLQNGVLFALHRVKRIAQERPLGQPDDARFWRRVNDIHQDPLDRIMQRRGFKEDA